MTTTQDSTVAARIPHDLRSDLEALAGKTGTGELTPIIRAALRDFVDRHLHGLPVYGREVPGVGLLDGGGTARRNDRATAKAAAAQAAPRAGSQRRRALELIADAGARGLTTDQVIAAMELEHGPSVAVNGIARRVTDLVQAGAIEPLTARLAGDGWRAIAELVDRKGDRDETCVGDSPHVTRRTRHGSAATVWVATAKGLRWAQENTR